MEAKHKQICRVHGTQSYLITCSICLKCFPRLCNQRSRTEPLRSSGTAPHARKSPSQPQRRHLCLHAGLKQEQTLNLCPSEHFRVVKWFWRRETMMRASEMCCCEILHWCAEVSGICMLQPWMQRLKKCQSFGLFQS